MTQILESPDTATKSCFSAEPETLWDEQILHLAGHTIGGVPIMLVTTDGKMKECAQKVMPSCEIVTFADYLQLLNN